MPVSVLVNRAGQHLGYNESAPPPPPPPVDPPDPPAISPTTMWGAQSQALAGETGRAAMLRVEKAIGRGSPPRLDIIRYFHAINAGPAWPTAMEPLDGRSLVYSYRYDIAQVIAGQADAALRTMFTKARTYLNANPGSRFYYCLNHEPELEIINGSYTAAQYRAAWNRMIDIQENEFPHARMFPTAVLMKYTLDAASGRNFDDYFVPRMKCISFDVYKFTPGNTVASMINAVVTKAKLKGVRWGISETGVEPQPPASGHTDAQRKTALTDLANYIGTRTPAPDFCTYFNSDRNVGTDVHDWSIADEPAMSTAWKAGIPTIAPTPVDPPPDETTNGSVNFVSSGIVGGGFQNALAWSPFLDGVKRPLLIGADVSGPFRSEDGSQNWASAASGSISGGARVASYMWHDTIAGKAYALEDGGVHVSTTYGKTWTKKAAVANADGNGDKHPLPPEHPRATGYLMAQDNSTATKYFYVGTFNQGLKTSIDDFATVRATALVGYPIRSIALNRANLDEMFVAVNRGTAAQNGLWRVTGVRGTAPVATKLTSYPGPISPTNWVGPEELLCVQDGTITYLYVAGHEGGMFRFNVGAGTWTTINTGLPVGVVTGGNKPVWRSLCVDPSNPAVVYCGCWHPNNRQAIFKSTTRGGTWTAITGPNPVDAPATGPIVVDYTIYGGDEQWWLYDDTYHRLALNQEWIPAMLAVNPDDPNIIHASGRGGCWVGVFSPTNSRWTWSPAVGGLMVTVNMCVIPDHLVANRVAVGNMDYKCIASTDGGHTAVLAETPAAGLSVGDAGCMDMSQTTGPSRLYMGVSQGGQATGQGKIYSTLNPEAGPAATWVDENGTAFNGDVVGIAVGNNGSAQKVILASVSNSAGQTNGGLWRRVGATPGTWTQFRDPAAVPGGLAATTADHNQVNMRWRRNTAVVYAHDNDGLWRSNDAGATWVRIYNNTSFPGYGNYDSLALDPTDATKLYLVAGGILRRVNNASTAVAGAATVTTLYTPNAGPVAINPDGGEIFVHKSDGTIWRSTAFRTAADQAGCAWVDVSNAAFRQIGKGIRSMNVLNGGKILTADNGSGVFVGVRA